MSSDRAEAPLSKQKEILEIVDRFVVPQATKEQRDQAFDKIVNFVWQMVNHTSVLASIPRQFDSVNKLYESICFDLGASSLSVWEFVKAKIHCFVPQQNYIVKQDGIMWRHHSNYKAETRRDEQYDEILHRKDAFQNYS